MLTHRSISHQHISRLFFLASLEGFLALIAILVIPRENNTHILGYSISRLILIIAQFSISVISAGFWINLWKNTVFGQGLFLAIQKWSQERKKIKILQIVALIGFGAGSFLLLGLLITSDQYLKGILVRLAPLVVFIVLVCIQILWTIRFDLDQTATYNYWEQSFLILSIWIGLMPIWLLLTRKFIDSYFWFRMIVSICVIVSFFIIQLLGYFLFRNKLPKTVIVIALTIETIVFIRWSNINSLLKFFDLISPIIGTAIVAQILLILLYKFEHRGKTVIEVANIKIRLEAPQLTLWLIGIVTFLILAGYVSRISLLPGESIPINRFITLFSLEGEKNIPASFSTALLLFSAFLTFLIFFSKPAIDPEFRYHWFFLGLIFVVMGLDEFLSWHEALVSPLRRMISVRGAFSYEWVIVAIPLVLIVGIFFLRFLNHFPLNLRILIALAAALYVGGGLGGEMMEGWYASRFNGYDINNIILSVWEETLEMTGLVIFISALVQVLAFGFKKRGEPANK